MRKYVAPVILVLVLLIAGLIALDRAITTPQEELEELLDDLLQALSDEDKGSMRRLLLETFAYEGARPLGSGNLDKALERLDEYWQDTDKTRVTTKKREILVQGSVGVIKANGHVRFELSEGVVVYKVTFEIAALKMDEGWKAQSIHFTELTPGLF